MNRDAHAITKVTLRSTDFERTSRFYSQLFGWKFHLHSPTYLGFEPPAGIDGGFQRVDSFSPGDSVLIYILVDDFEPYLRRIPELDGTSAAEVEVVPGYGEYVRFNDPDGNRFALWRTVVRQPDF
ncbi:MAG: VOC family protein [Pyrinomonadaceae bacterium]|nr:VOC family protein [Pyrinomonadaceae bacterium]